MAHLTPEQRALAQAGGQLLPDGIRIGGWSVRAVKGPIIGDKQLEAYTRELGNVLTLPEMLFGNSSLTLTHEASGTVLAFTALDALKEWKAEDLPPLKVSIAGQWQAAREAEIERQQAVLLNYDWTYTTPYRGSLQRGVPRTGPPQAPRWQQQQGQQQQQNNQQQQQQNGKREGSGADEQQQQGEQATTAPVQGMQALAISDSQATASASAAANGAAPASSVPALTTTSQTAAATAEPATAAAAEPASSASAAPQWQPSEQQIDRSLLMQREPILFYQDVPLYESELDDNGVCALGVRVRVMAKCWFVLLRQFLRVDGTLVKLRETRLFRRLDDPQQARTVLRETRFCEGTYEQLRSAGAATPGSSFEDADSAAAIFNAIAPTCTTLFELHKLTV